MEFMWLVLRIQFQGHGVPDCAVHHCEVAHNQSNHQDKPDQNINSISASAEVNSLCPATGSSQR